MAEGDPFPSIGEAQARGEIAAIYADIRRTLEAPLVNLVWRALAAVPGALPWAWGSVKPLHGNGRAARAAERLRNTLVLPSVRTISACDLRVNGVSEMAERQIVRTVVSYARANLINAVTFSALQVMPVGGQAPSAWLGARVERVSLREVDDEPLPSLLAMGEMSPATAEQVRQVSCLGRDPRTEEVQVSLPRQLAHWPGFLGLWLEAFADAEQDGSLREAADLAADAVRTEGGRLAQGASALTVLSDPKGQAQARAIIEAIVPMPIGRMLVLVETLRRALGERALPPRRSGAEERT
ncbi:MAG: hypothetical protein AAGA68_22160 [Pseudomonadota bacterium]